MILTATATYKDAEAKKYEKLLLENEKDSYREYVAKNGVEADALYQDAAAAAKNEAMRSGAKYGAQGEAFFSTGLSTSGYADYINGIAKENYRRGLGYAEHLKALGGYQNTTSYEAYVSDYEKMQDKIAESFVDSFSKSGSFDIDSALKNAIKAGLNSDRAHAAATNAVNKAKENAYERVILFAKANGLTPLKAEEYAKALGLDERYQKRVYDQISVFTDQEKAFYSSMTPQQYYDYILSLAER